MPAFKNFGITFLISTIVFSIVAYFAVGYYPTVVSGILDDEHDRLDELFTQAVDDSDKIIETLPEDEIPQVEGDSFTVLFCITDERGDIYEYYPHSEKAISKISTDAKKSVGLLAKDYHTVKVKSIVLMRVSKETGSYTFISIPSISKVYTQMGAGSVLLEDVLYFYEEEYFVQKVSAMTGITPDYSVFVNVTDLDDVLKQTGGFTCHVKQDIYSDGKEYFPEPPEETTTEETKPPETTKKDKDKGKDKDKDKKETSETEEEKVVLEKVVSAGNVTVGASNIEALILYEDYTDGVKDRSEFLCEIVKGFVGRLSLMDNDQMTNVFRYLVKKNKISTNMEESHLLAKADLIRAYGTFASTTVEYPGVMNGKLFIPNIPQASKNYMGLRLPPDPAKNS